VAWLTDEELLDELAAVLKTTGGRAALQAHYTLPAAAANRRAKAFIRQFVVERGYVAASAELWELANPYHRSFGLYLIGVDSRSNFSEAEAADLNRQDPRDEMAKLGTLLDATGAELPRPDTSAVTNAGAGIPDWRKALDAATAPAHRAARIYPPAVVPPAGWGYGGP
jgi:hypothetical protein